MKSKCVVSIAIVMTLGVLSVVAFASSFGMPCKEVYAQRMVYEAEFVIDIPKPDRMEHITTKAVITEHMEEETSQSCSSGLDLSVEDACLLARIAMAEAEGEDVEGKALVIRTILNRVGDESFPNTIRSVIMQKGQFSPVSDGRFDSVVPDEECWSALELVARDLWDCSSGATYFESRSDSTWHIEHLEYLFQHGNHYFYKDWE